MNRIARVLGLAAAIGLCLVLWGTSYPAQGQAPGACNNEDQDVCLTVTLSQPIQLNQSVTVTLTVVTKVAQPQATVFLYTSNPRDVPVSGPDQWTISTSANQPVTLTGTVRFTQPTGWFDVIGLVQTRDHRPVTDGELIHMTVGGGVLNPTEFGEPEILVEPLTPDEPLFIPPAIPADRSLSRLSPAQALGSCGWTTTTTPPNWAGAKAYVQVPALVSIGQPVPVVVEFENINTTPANAPVRLGLCPDASVQIEGDREWTVTVQPGVPVFRTTTVRFTQAGNFALRAVALNTAANRLTNGGQRAWAVTEPPEGIAAAALNASQWVTITTETFESYWPSSSWAVSDLSNDGFDRKWDEDNYKPRTGSYAAWPARAGYNGRKPTTANNTYFNNLNTRMAYGPFDLSNATVAEASFWLWRQTETTADYLVLEASTDGVNYTQELGRWSGAWGWQQQTVSLNALAGQSRVWVAWRFYSNGVNSNYEGVWVDDVLIRKYVPGEVTVSGVLQYYDRLGNLLPAGNVLVQLIDNGPYSVIEVLSQTTTQPNGDFAFAPRRNWDVNDLSPNPLARRLDLEVRFVTTNDTLGAVTNMALTPETYDWSVIRADVSDGTVNYSYTIPQASNYERAMWLFQDIARAWTYIHDQTGEDPGKANVRWILNTDVLAPCGSSCFYPWDRVYGVFIAHRDSLSADVVVHELGHRYMSNAHGYWLFRNWGEYAGCFDHQLFSQESQLCSWAEGWASLLALAVNGDSCFDRNAQSCGSQGTSLIPLQI